jgi:hypothetical protein
MTALGPLLLVAAVVFIGVVLARRAQGKPMLAAQSAGSRLAFVVAGFVVVCVGATIVLLMP